MEAGVPAWTVARDGSDKVRTISLSVSLQYGLSERVEMRASLPTWNDVRTELASSVSNDEGFGDAEVGAK